MMMRLMFPYYNLKSTLFQSKRSRFQQTNINSLAPFITPLLAEWECIRLAIA